MSNEKQNNPDPKSSLIDRRFFLKASSATVVAAAASAVISTSLAENQIPVSKNDVAQIPADSKETNKQWKAGWMAF